MRRLHKGLLIVLLVMLLAVAGLSFFHPDEGKPTVWQDGILDLSEWNPVADGVVSLNGIWELYWGRLLTPAEIGKSGGEEPLRVKVPAVWSSALETGTPLSNTGYATYRLRFRLPEGPDHIPLLSLYVRGIATSYKLWINGQPAAANGTVGIDRHEMVPYNLPKVISFQPQPGMNELVIEVANFVQRKGGIWETIQLGGAADVARERTVRFGSEMFMIGSLLAMGFYHVGLYAARSKERSSLYFGALCMAVVVRTSVLGEGVALYFFPAISWETAVKFEYGSAIFGMHMLLLFVHREYAAKPPKGIVAASLLVQGAFLALVLATPARVYTRLMDVYQLLVVLPLLLYLLVQYLRSSLRMEAESAVNLAGFVAFAAAIMGDILFFNHLIPRGDFLPYGLLFFLFTQSINLSLKFARTAKAAESLSAELRSANDTLEERIRDRTEALQQSYDELARVNGELSRLEQFRSRLLSDISHELGTPITAIRGYAIAMAEGMIVDDYAKYARRIYERSRLLERLIEDLTELTKLETKQIQFVYRKVAIVPFVRQLYRQYELELLERAAEFVLETPTESDEAAAWIDPIRIEQVVSNVLSNAKKYIPEDGSVKLGLKLVPSEGGVTGEAVISVTDNGPGIPEEELQAVFDRFYRSRSSKSSVRGTGLGLSICKQIVTYHQGRIGAENIPGSGCRLFFTLPIVYAGKELPPSGDNGPVS